jgi:hypothetical protein
MAAVGGGQALFLTTNLTNHPNGSLPLCKRSQRRRFVTFVRFVAITKRLRTTG